MKKILALILATLTVVSCSMVAFASETVLTVNVPEAKYTLNIPANQTITFGSEETNIGSVSVTNSSGFAVGKSLYVTVTYDAFKCEGVSTKIPFKMAFTYVNELTYPKYVNSGDEIEFPGKSNGKCYEYPQFENSLDDHKNTWVLIDSSDWGKTLSGEYSATITFSAKVDVR